LLRYFFVVQGPQEAIDDPEGIVLASDNAAIAHGLEFIREIKKAGGDDPGLSLVVKDEQGRTVLSIPF
jgi:hypothetical protein